MILELQTTVAEKIDLQNILNALSNLYDEDFNGNNGEDYIDEDVLEQGYESNQDYVLNFLEEKYKDVDFIESEENQQFYGNINDIISEYLEMWLGNDSYYMDYKYTFDFVNGGLVISLTTISD